MKNFVVIVLIIGIIVGAGYGVFKEVEDYKKKHWTESTNAEEKTTIPEVK